MSDEHETSAEPRMLRLVLEVPADGFHDLVALLAPLKHIAYRSDLWLTERRDEGPPSPRSSDNGVAENDDKRPGVSREPL